MKDQLAQDRFLLSQPKLRSKPAQKIVDLLLVPAPFRRRRASSIAAARGVSPVSSVCASAFRLRVSIVVRTRRLTAVARPSWAALTIPRAHVANTTTWRRS